VVHINGSLSYLSHKHTNSPRLPTGYDPVHTDNVATVNSEGSIHRNIARHLRNRLRR
jgi:hypothetical protein